MRGTKCLNCGNYAEGKWCPGCEHNFPGLDQFDFYQEIRHTILMVETGGAARTKYENVVRQEVRNGYITLYLDNGEIASFPNNGYWLLFDLTPTLGWNERPGCIPEVVQNVRQVKVNLVRRRDCEGSVWVDELYLIINADKFNEKEPHYWEDANNIETEVRQLVQSWLTTEKGWRANVRTSLDFNWGDLVAGLPVDMNGVALKENSIADMAINASVDICVNQDEHLAPWVEAEVRKADGTEVGTATVDFSTGDIYSLTSDKVLPKYGEPLLVVTEGGMIPAVWDKDTNRLHLVE